MWLNATEPDCIKFSAENNGWILDDFLKQTGFLGDSKPTQVESSINNRTDNEDDSDIYFDDKSECNDDTDFE